MDALTGLTMNDASALVTGAIVKQSVPQANLQQKASVLNFHNYQLSINPKHKQADTIKHFSASRQFLISRSSLNRWIANEDRIKRDALQLSSKSRSLTKVRKLIKPAMIKVEEFFRTHAHVIKCLELYCIQNLLTQPQNTLVDKEILLKFNEFKQIFREPVVQGTLIANESWPQMFVNHKIKYQIDSIRDNLAEQAAIHKASKVLVQEKERLQLILGSFTPDSIYQFSDLIFDLDRLFGIAEMNGVDIEEIAAEEALEDHELRHQYTVTFGLLGNATGTDFPDPLIVSNMLGNSMQATDDPFYYDPEGYNRREILREYLHKWDTKLSADGKSIALLLDTHWSHFGLGEKRLQKFANIKLVFINAKYDQANLAFHRSQLRLPFSIGLERFVKYQLKMRLFNKLYKDIRVVGHRNEVFEDAIGIVNNMRISYNLIVNRIQTDPLLATFYKLGFDGLRLLEPIAASGDIRDDQAKNVYGRLTSFVRPLIPVELRPKLQFSDTTRKLIVKPYEQELYQFIKGIARATMKLNPNRIYDLSQLHANILREFCKGRDERKLNRQYSMEAIVEYVRLTMKFKETRDRLKAKAATDAQEILSTAHKVDECLLNEVQPFLHRLHQQRRRRLHDADVTVAISDTTFELFNRFYAAYIEDTAVIDTKRKYSDRRRKSPRPSLLDDDDLGRKRPKLNKFIADSDISDDDTASIAPSSMVSIMQSSTFRPLSQPSTATTSTMEEANFMSTFLDSDNE